MKLYRYFINDIKIDIIDNEDDLKQNQSSTIKRASLRQMRWFEIWHTQAMRQYRSKKSHYNKK